MNFVGIDLHKKTISICVVSQTRDVLDRKRFFCSAPERIARRRPQLDTPEGLSTQRGWSPSTSGSRECAGEGTTVIAGLG